jgi:hypothetical protein
MIADVAGKCPHTDDKAKVLCERIELLFWKIGWKAVNVDIRNAQLARVCFSHGRRLYTRWFGVKLNPGNRIR